MNKTIASIVAAGTLISGGVDASILNERVEPVAIKLAGNDVAFKQENNVAETTFPWKDQPGIKVKYNLGEPTIAERFLDKRDKNVLVETVDFGEGGFKIDVILDKKPATNRFCYQIEGWENYDFFYQPALTAEEIAQGASRPEEIVGSYAVYHKELRNHRIGSENYATGKVMHIPFPYVWEVNDLSTKQRAENLEYQNGELCVTVQQDFLDKANYPVRVDPTFGYTSVGGTTGNFTANWVSGQKGLPASAGTVDSISAYALDAEATADFKGVLVLTSSKTIVANGITDVYSNVPNSWDWRVATYTTKPSITTVNYYASVIFNEGASNKYDNVASGQFADFTNNYITPTDPTDGTEYGDYRSSIYATYTASAGGSPAGLRGNVNIKGGGNFYWMGQ